MKLLIVRHGDPDYSIDSLTEKGFREAELLSDRLAKISIDEIYCSPLGRAMDTASPTLDKRKQDMIIVPWLEEFNYARITDPENKENTKQIWDFTPGYFVTQDLLFDKDNWQNAPAIKNFPAVFDAYRTVCGGVDSVLLKHGYRRSGNLYTAQAGSHDTVVFFCHLGVQCVILSHLLGISPVLLAQNFFIAPTGVTTLITEERKAGIASFRCQAMGDISHLYAAGEEPSFSGRFCECYTDQTRH